MDVEISESTLTQESLVSYMNDRTLLMYAFPFINSTLRLALSWDWNTVSSTVLLLYDWILLLPEEIEFIWSAKLLRPFNALYNIQRYMPFIDTVALLYIVSFAEPIDVEKCRVLYNISGWMYITGITLTEGEHKFTAILPNFTSYMLLIRWMSPVVVLTMRIWALWGKDIRLSIGLPLFFLSCWVPNFYIFHKFLQTQTYIPSPLPQIIGCAILGGQPILYLCWVILVVYEAVLLILMLIQYRSTNRSGRQLSLTRVVYRDGITYYIILFLLSIMNVATILLLPVRKHFLYISKIPHVLCVFSAFCSHASSCNPKIKFSDYVKFNYTAQVQLGLGAVMMQLKEKKYGIRYAWQWLSFGAAFVVAANVHATQVHVFWLTLEGSQSLANNRGRIPVARQQSRFLFGPAFLIAANVHAT
ncbi:hypothetical protein DFH05DRAFT_1456965 [Lentinula detonsa]|uniref:DUF6533 domain-containing protein n=1 Tax=Lentinula detonsa TaxID=2804962 RepID=A0A9W8P8H0_9AGAR|nr:hypothetical protein DFH05DRAFT_1456965 [Lentinula detonsa]